MGKDLVNYSFVFTINNSLTLTHYISELFYIQSATLNHYLLKQIHLHTRQ